MSFIDSPPIRRLSASAGSTKGQEDLINAYEAEEERIINVLSRKLEQLREDKIDLENVLEAESEAHVNRLSRELTALRIAQQNGHGSVSPGARLPASFMSPTDPSTDVLLEAMRRENEQLRTRLVDTERDYIRISRLNEIYREELIDHRKRLGLPVDNLIGMSSAEPFSQPTHLRSNGSSPSTSVMVSPRTIPHAIPRPPIHRPIPSEGNTPLSHSPASSESPFPLSPSASTNPASFVSYNTTLTSPPSSSFNPLTFTMPSRGLTYPSVPPPSLSSSFGSPTVNYHMRDREASLSPVEPLSRRGSISNVRRGSHDWRIAETGTLRNNNSKSVERGSLARSRASSQSLPSTSETPDDDTNSAT